MKGISRQTQKIAVLIIFIALAVNIWHLPKGFSSRDSSSWLGIIYRFSRGDIPIIHEWHPAQMSAILLIPFMKLYLAVNGSTDGVVLFFRIVYTFIINLPTALFMLYKEKHHGWIPASLLCAVVLLFTMGGEVLPDYNTMGVSFVLLFSLLFTQPGKKFNRDLFLSGLFYAAAVLCCPYMAVFYFLFAAICMILRMKKNGNSEFYLSRFIPFTCGAFVLAVIVISYLLSKAGISQYIGSVGQLFRDPDHPTSRFSWAVQFFKLLKAVWRTTKGTIIIFPVYTAVFMMLFLLRKNTKAKGPLMVLLLTITTILIFAYRDSIHNFAMIIFVPLGALTILLDKNHDKNLEKMFRIGIIYILMINLTSNTVLNAASSASMICLIPSVLMFSDYLEKTSLNFKKCIVTMFILSLCTLTGFMIWDRFTRIFQDEAPYTLKTEITEGPMKYTYTTEMKNKLYHEQYMMILQDMNAADSAIFYFGQNSWPYLLGNRTFGTYALWIKEYRESDIYRLKEYYSLFPDHIPDKLYLMDDSLQYTETAIQVLKDIKPNLQIVNLTVNKLQNEIK